MQYKTSARSSKVSLQGQNVWFISVGVYNSVRTMHTKSIKKLQIFGPEGARGRSSREKTGSGEHMCAAPQREIDFDQKCLESKGEGGGNDINLEKRNV